MPQIHQWLFAQAMRLGMGPYERAVAERKRELFRGLSGTILEIGAGAGSNLPYFPASAHYLALEPNPHFHPHLRRAAARLRRTIHILPHRGEQTTLPSESVDAVVCTLVLCSVHPVQPLLDEVLRVLKPGGCFAILEHVAADPGSRLRRWQDRIQPLWSLCFDGCRPNAETLAALETAAFQRSELVHFHTRFGPVAPHLAARLWKAT
jgi:SAM-dependent methyltransferase